MSTPNDTSNPTPEDDSLKNLALAAMDFARARDAQSEESSDSNARAREEQQSVRALALPNASAKVEAKPSFTVDLHWLVCAIDAVALPPSDAGLLRKIHEGDVAPKAVGRLQRTLVTVDDQELRFTHKRGGVSAQFRVPVASSTMTEPLAFTCWLLALQNMFPSRPYAAGKRAKRIPLLNEHLVTFELSGDDHVTLKFGRSVLPLPVERSPVTGNDELMPASGAITFSSSAARSLARALEEAAMFSVALKRGAAAALATLTVADGQVRGGSLAAVTIAHAPDLKDFTFNVTKDDVYALSSMLARVGPFEAATSNGAWAARDGRLSFRVEQPEYSFPSLEVPLATMEKAESRYSLPLVELWRGAAWCEIAQPVDSERKPTLACLSTVEGQEEPAVLIDMQGPAGAVHWTAPLLPKRQLVIPARVTLRAKHLKRAAEPASPSEVGKLFLVPDRAAMIEVERDNLTIRHLLVSPL